MHYDKVKQGTFIDRPNRFIANCELDGHRVVTHVKNTGRSKELLIPGETTVALNYQPKPTRKTNYDLVAVQKRGQWVNIDSQAPNKIVLEAYTQGELNLPGIGTLAQLKPEVVYDQSRLDFCGETDSGETLWIEVKGVTLENDGVVAFPDAPTTRAVKHVHELTRIVGEGQSACLLFVIQLAFADVMTIYQQRAPKLAVAIQEAQAAGVHVIAMDCNVTANSLSLRQTVPFDPNSVFHEA